MIVDVTTEPRDAGRCKELAKIEFRSMALLDLHQRIRNKETRFASFLGANFSFILRKYQLGNTSWSERHMFTELWTEKG